MDQTRVWASGSSRCKITVGDKHLPLICKHFPRLYFWVFSPTGLGTHRDVMCGLYVEDVDKRNLLLLLIGVMYSSWWYMGGNLIGEYDHDGMLAFWGLLELKDHLKMED